MLESTGLAALTIVCLFLLGEPVRELPERKHLRTIQDILVSLTGSSWILTKSPYGHLPFNWSRVKRLGENGHFDRTWLSMPGIQSTDHGAPQPGMKGNAHERCNLQPLLSDPQVHL